MPESLAVITEEIEDEAETLGDVERSTRGGQAMFARSGRLFAAADASGFDFRVGATIAGAAFRTPDTRASSRGSDWVRFEPVELERTAVDRAVSWFGAAWRRASED
jgi:hypothetical protein